MAKVEVSIVICTHRRVDLLKGAVQSLIEQSASSENYEVIIVDNGVKLNEGIRKIVERAKKQISIRYLNEKRIGLSYARNTGGKSALSDYVWYIDDDARTNNKYVETLIRILHEHKPDICGGPLYPFYLDPKPNWFLDRYGSSSKGEKPRYLKSKEYLNGGNIVFRKKLLEELGWFDIKYGMSGKRLWYGEETLMMINAWKTRPDLQVFYHPELFIHHFVQTWKMSVWNILRIAYRKGKSQAYFWIPEAQHQAARIRAPINLMIRLLYLAAKFFPGVTFRNRQQYPFWQNYIVEKIAGYLASIGVYLRLTTDFLFSWIKKSS